MSFILVSALLISGTVLVVQYNRAGTHAAPITSFPANLSSENRISSVNILLVCEENKIAEDIYILNYSPITQETSLLTIPGNTQIISLDTTDKTPRPMMIKDFMQGQGVMPLIDYIKANYGMNIRYYVRFDYGALKQIVDGLDQVPFLLPADLQSDTTNLSGAESEQNFTGKMAVELFRFTTPWNHRYSQTMLDHKLNFNQTSENRTILHAKFIIALLSSKGNPNYIPKLQGILKDCGTRVSTNISAEAFTQLEQDAAKISLAKITHYILDGTWQEDKAQSFLFNNHIKKLGEDAGFSIEILSTEAQNKFLSPSIT